MLMWGGALGGAMLMWGWGTRRGYVGVEHHRRGYVGVGHNGRGYVGVGHNRRSYVGVSTIGGAMLMWGWGTIGGAMWGWGTIGGAMLSWGWGSKQGADIYMEEELC